MKKNTHSMRVEFSYSLQEYFEGDHDTDLVKLAKKYKFKKTGSGAGGDTRDISFESKSATERATRKFVEAARKQFGKKFFSRVEIIETTATVGESYYI